MFEDQDKNSKSVPNAKDAQDMFAGVDTGPVPGSSFPESKPLGGSDYETKEGIRPQPLIIAGVAVVVLILIVGLVWFFKFRNSDNSDIGILEPVNSALPLEIGSETQSPTIPPALTNEEPAGSGVVVEPEPVPEVPKDSDQDGLTDTREFFLGTDPELADTDGDGLSDKDEVDVYHSDPLDTDTDNDTYLDGAEVTSGYSPIGPGKLLEVPTL